MILRWKMKRIFKNLKSHDLRIKNYNIIVILGIIQKNKRILKVRIVFKRLKKSFGGI